MKPSSETKANKSNKAKSKYQNVRDWDITIYDFITNFGFLFDLKMSLYVCVHRKIIH